MAYVGVGCGDVDVVENPFPSQDWSLIRHSTKGGVRLTEHITYNCLVDDPGKKKYTFPAVHPTHNMMLK